MLKIWSMVCLITYLPYSAATAFIQYSCKRSAVMQHVY